MRSLVLLELRKQGKTFLGLLLIIVITLSLVTASVSMFADQPLAETFLSVTVLLQALGIPFFGLILGGGAGAALRGIDRKAEEDIPVRPIKRVFAAYIASLTYLLFLATILFVASAPHSYSSDVQASFQVPLIMVMLLPLHSAAFVFSYWLSQALLGSVVSVIATIAPAYWLYLNEYLFSPPIESVPQIIISILTIMFYPFWFFGGFELILISLLASPAIIATVVHLTLLVWLVKRIEREKRTWLPMKIAIAILLLGALSLSFWGIFLFGASNDLTHYRYRHFGHMHSCPKL